jgi:hypothetical protein
LSATGGEHVAGERRLVVERGDAREILGNPQERRTQAFLEKVL